MTPRPWFTVYFPIHFFVFLYICVPVSPIYTLFTVLANFLQGLLETLQVYLDTGIVITAPRPLIIIPLDNVDKCCPHDSLIGSDLEAALTEGHCMHTLVH